MDVRAFKALIEANTRATRNPLGVKEEECSRWAEGLGLPEKGDTLLFTGCLYQMVPFIEMYAGMLQFMEGRSPGMFRFLVTLASIPSRLGVSASSLMAPLMLDRKLVERYNSIVRGIAEALMRAGVEFAYMRREPYNGALYHDLGMDDLFESHARYVAEKITETGASTVITIDPHTTHALKLIVEMIDGFDVEVIHYLRVLEGRGYRPERRVDLPVAIHDPCYLARWNGVVEEPRRLAEIAGVDLREPDFSKRFTGCCGGPLESLFPTLAKEIARVRLRELKEAGGEVAMTLCPICLVNLSREANEVGMEVRDIWEVMG